VEHSAIAPFRLRTFAENTMTLNADGTLDYSFNSAFTSEDGSITYVIEGSGVLSQ